MVKLQDMDPKIIDGKKLAQELEEKVKQQVAILTKKPKIVSILVGDDPSSVLYTRIKEKKAKEVGITFSSKVFPGTARFDAVLWYIGQLNNDPDVTGIMVQLPLPKEFLDGFDLKEVLDTISPQKDVDGLTGKGLLPATVEGVLRILGNEQFSVKDKSVVVVGKSDEVGKPLAEHLIKMGADVIVCDSKTSDLKSEVQKGDLVVSATGIPFLITGEMVKNGAVVIDVGAEKVNGKLVGDVDFNSVYPKASKITPVPGGVGPMTVVSLMENAVKLTK